MNATKKLVSLSRVAARHFHKSRAVCATEENMVVKRERIRKLQDKFQIDDGTPVYLKGGLTDRLLFGATIVLTVVGIGMSADTVWKLMNKS